MGAHAKATPDVNLAENFGDHEVEHFEILRATPQVHRFAIFSIEARGPLEFSHGTMADAKREKLVKHPKQRVISPALEPADWATSPNPFAPTTGANVVGESIAKMDIR